jgi:methionine-rich copper-binding protein CopC
MNARQYANARRINALTAQNRLAVLLLAVMLGCCVANSVAHAAMSRLHAVSEQLVNTVPAQVT